MSVPAPAPETAPDAEAPEYFAPSWGRALFAALLAFLAFLLPQKIALEWYPLNEPGNDIHYLEATLRTSNTGNIRIIYDCGFGFVEPYNITIPVAPSDMAFTYTFPLPDAPLRKLYIDPVDAPGELEFTRLRIINRREEEVRNFSPDEFKISEGLRLEPTLHGWKLVATEATAFDAGADVDFLPVRPVGMNYRNVLRCLLSWSYLSFMLWLIVLAIYFATLRHRRGKDILRACAFLLLICCLMAFVGTRGMLKNTYRISKFKPVKVPSGHTLEFEVAAQHPADVSLITHPTQPGDHPAAPLADHPHLQPVRFPLTDLSKDADVKLRLPDGAVKVMPLRIRDGGRYTVLEIPVSALQPREDTVLTTTDGRHYIQLREEDADREFTLDPEYVQKIAALLSAPPRVTP